MSKLTRSLNKFGLKAKKYMPEALVVTGIAGLVTSAVMACRETTKASSIIDELNEELETIERVAETADEEKYNQEDHKKDVVIAYSHASFKFAKLYAPSVILGAASIVSILAGHNMTRKRNAALAAAYATIDRGFKEYRDRVVDRFGRETDKELKYNIKAQEIEEKTVDENGNEIIEKKIINVAGDPNTYSAYARVYDDGCTGWSKDPESNCVFLKQQMNWANEKLKREGYLFLNDVYKMLGIPATKAGQCVGWIYDENNPIGDNYVDFGIYDISIPKVRDFINGYERNIILDFNVDGNILDLI